jgi:hypothetical protein
MKKSSLFILFICVSFLMKAQAPQSFSYQTVIRDGNGDLVANQLVSLQFVVLNGALPGTVVYAETHQVTSNSLGIVNLAVGEGTVETGDFGLIDWSSGPFYLKVKADITGGVNYVDMGDSKLLSVPYALYSRASEDAFSGNYSDLTGAPVNVSAFGNDAGYITNPDDADADPSNELQILSALNDTLFLSNGGFVSLSGYSDTLWRLSGVNIHNTNGGKVGIGTPTPPAKLVVQGDSTMADTIPLFEVKDKAGHTVFIVYPDSARLYVCDDGSKTSKGAFAVSGRNTAKQMTHDFFWVTPDSTRVYTGDSEAGFGVENIEIGGTQRYMKLTPDNYFIGHESGVSLNGGLYNCFLGYQAGRNTGSGSNNIYIGYQSGRSNLSGHDNVGIGTTSLFTNTGGNFNTAIGTKSMYLNLTGSWNTAIGYEALHSNSTGIYNCALGFQALRSNNTGVNNTAIGYKSLFSSTNGALNSAIGHQTLYSNTSGYCNVANGNEALYSNTSGAFNIAIGYKALYSNTVNNCNIATGDYALYNNQAGYNNIATGSYSLNSNTSGTYNVSYGFYSLKNNTIGSFNVAAGSFALESNISGAYNTAIGDNALRGNTASWNTALGYAANGAAGSYINTTALGAFAIITASDQVRIGDNYVTSIGGFANWTNVSDNRLKKDITENVPGLDFILKLKPVTYHLDMKKIAECFHFPDSLRNNASEVVKGQMLQTGFIAQDVEKAATELGYDFSGVDKPKNSDDFYGLRYAEFTVPLVKAVQELHAENKQLREDNLLQQQIVEDLLKRIEKLESR